MDRISISELTTLRWPLEEDVDWLNRFGFGAIGIWREKLSDFGEEKGVELLREQELAVSSVHWAGGFTGSDGRTFKDSLGDALEAIDLASELNASCLIVHSGGQGGHTDRHALRLLRTALDAMLPYAEANQVRLALEPMASESGRSWTILRTIRDTLELVRQVDSDSLGLVWDLYHTSSESNVIEQFAEEMDRLFLVQIADVECRETRIISKTSCWSEQCRCLIGTGLLDVTGLMQELDGHGYDGWFEVELLGEALESHSYEQILQQTRESLFATYSGMSSKQTR